MDLKILESMGIANPIDIKWIILPAALLAVYTLIILFLMAMKRKRAAKDGSVDPKYFRLYQGDGLTDELQLWNRHFNNLLETPILFYFATIIAVITHQVTTLIYPSHLKMQGSARLETAIFEARNFWASHSS